MEEGLYARIVTRVFTIDISYRNEGFSRLECHNNLDILPFILYMSKCFGHKYTGETHKFASNGATNSVPFALKVNA